MASRFWVGGTGTWDASDTTHWASVTNGAGGASVPTSADTATFDSSSGTGTITISGDHSITSFTCTSGAGLTFDWSVNNNNLTLAANFIFNSSSANTLKLGNGTFTAGAAWSLQNAALTFFPGNATVVLGDPMTATDKSFVSNPHALTNVVLGPVASVGGIIVNSNVTMTNLTVVAPCKIKIPASVIITTTTLTTTNTKGKTIEWRGTGSSIAGLSVASGTVEFNWSTFRWIAFQGGATFKANNSLDLGLNTGIAISPPKSGLILGG